MGLLEIFSPKPVTRRAPLVLSEDEPQAADRYGKLGSLSDFGNTGSAGWTMPFGGGKTDAGVIVNPKIALQFTAVFASIGLIADNLSQCPLNLMRKTTVNGKVTRAVATDHPLQAIVSDTPNAFMGGFTLRQTIQGHVGGYGNGYMEIERTRGGDPIALWPLLPDNTRPQKRDGDLWYSTAIDGKSYTLNAHNVLHISGYGWDGICGYSPLEQCRQAVGLALAAETFGAKFFQNDSKSGGFLMHPGKLGSPAVKNIADSFTNEQGGLDNANRVKVLEEGMKFVSTTIPPNDAQFLATREFQVEEIARLYRIPPVLLQSMVKTSSWGTGIEQLMIGFITFTLTPLAVRWEEELNRKLLTEDERKAGYYFKINLNALARGDMAARAAFYGAGIKDGWMNRNQPRELEDWDDATGLDTFLVPLNMATVNPETGAIEQPAQAAATETPPADPPENPTEPAAPPATPPQEDSQDE